MGLIADDHEDLPDQDMLDQLAMTLCMLDSEFELTGKYIGGRHGPFIDIKLPLRQAVQLAYDTLRAKGVHTDIIC